MDIEDVKMRRGHSAIEFRRQGLPFGQVTSTNQDLPIAGLPQLGHNGSSRCAVAANNAESDGSAHCCSSSKLLRPAWLVGQATLFASSSARAFLVPAAQIVAQSVLSVR